MHTYRDNTETMGIATIGRNILDIKIALILQMLYVYSLGVNGETLFNGVQIKICCL
jgi:hypothetical protein